MGCLPMSKLWRTIKVFVSSTFRDLELERDRLYHLFRNLEKEVLHQSLTLRPYDLRWKDRHSEEPLLEWCLRMVRECQYFIGILNGRYGWRPLIGPGGIPNSGGLSITEMEIHHALEKIQRDRRFFCFGPSHSDSGETPEDLDSLEALKKSLRDRGERIYEYERVEELLEMIGKVFRSLLHRDFPAKEIDPSDNGDSSLVEWIEEKSLGFTGRKEPLKKLHHFALSLEKPNYLVLQARAGSGKSALLARFIQERNEGKIPLISHFMSLGGESREIQGVMESLGNRMVEKGLLKRPLKIDPRKRQNQIRRALQKIKAPLILLIDGLDEIEAKGQDLHWLPRDLPPQVRVILSTRPTATWEALQGFPRWLSLTLPPMEEEEIFSIMDDYTEENHLHLTPSDRALLALRAAGNPLYLKVALNEILSSGKAVGQLALSVEALFEQILEEFSEKYGSDLIDLYLGLIAAGKFGILERELEEILEVKDEILLPLTKSLSNFIVLRKGLLNFFHPEFERTVKVWDGKTGKCLQTLFGHGAAVYSVVFSPDGKRVLSGSYDKTLRLWDVSINLSSPHLKGHDGWINSLVLSLDETKMASGGQDKTIRIWDLTSPKILKILTGHQNRVGAVAFSPDGKRLLSGSHDKTIRLWNWETGKTLKVFKGHLDWIGAVAFNSDGRKIASGSADGTVRIWSVKGRLLQSLEGHQSEVCQIVFHPKQKKLISASADGTLRIWDVMTGKCVGILEGHGDRVYQVILDERGDRLISSSFDKTLKIWDFEARKCLKTLEGMGELHSLIEPEEKIPYRILNRNLETQLIDKGTGEILATFPVFLGGVAYSPGSGIILGYRGDYVYFLRVCGMGKK